MPPNKHRVSSFLAITIAKAKASIDKANRDNSSEQTESNRIKIMMIAMLRVDDIHLHCSGLKVSDLPRMARKMIHRIPRTMAIMSNDVPISL